MFITTTTAIAIVAIASVAAIIAPNPRMQPTAYPAAF
jgi:hypothetical protein